MISEDDENYDNKEEEEEKGQEQENLTTKARQLLTDSLTDSVVPSRSQNG